MPTAKPVDLIISPSWVVPIIPDNIVLDNHSVVIEHNRLLDILPTDQVLQHYQAKNHIHRPGHALMPGLINCHAHTPMNLFRGLADDLKLMDWLTQHIWPAEQEIINAGSVEAGTRLAIAEMLRGGTTLFNDHYFYPDVIANTAINEGIRACVGLVVMNVSTGWAKDEDQYIKKMQSAYQQRPKNPLISWAVAPHATYTNSDSSLARAKEFADQHNLPIHMHLNETLEEIQMDIRNHGKRCIERLAQLDLLSNRLLAVHMVHLSEQEMQLVQQHQVNVIHNPESNSKLASGIAPIAALLKMGVNVALGTDGAASNNDLDMFSELKMAALLAKAQTQDPTTLPASQALAMATINGAKALGMENELGSIEKGKLADVICVNLDSFLTQPVYNPISHLVYAVNRLQVSDVWIDGKQLLNQGEFTQLDVERTVAQTKQWSEQAKIFSSKEVSHATTSSH